MTDDQLVVLRNDITITKAAVVYLDQTLLEWWNAGDDTTIANFYHQLAVPNYYVWKRTTVAPLMATQGFDWTRVDNMTVDKGRVWEFMMQAGALDFAETTVRNGVETAFSIEAADQPCRQAVYNGASRLATYAEQLYAIGTGTAPTHHGVGPGRVVVMDSELTPTEIGQCRSV